MKYRVHTIKWVENDKSEEIEVCVEADCMWIGERGHLGFSKGDCTVALFDSWLYAVEEPCCEGECRCAG
jgi:hypothetical protein